MTPSPSTALVSAVLFGVFAAGCGGAPTDAPAEEGEASSAPAPAAPSQPRDACALVDVDELNAIAERTLTGEARTYGPDKTGCELGDASGGEPLVYVSVLWSGGRDQAQAQQGGMALARELMNEPGIDIEALTGSGAEPGLADQAYYSDLMPSWVLKDDVLIEIASPMFESERSRRTFMAVAETAVRRLQP